MDAEDYMHEAFMKINKVIDTIDIDKCKTYITKITINNAIDNLRKRKCLEDKTESMELISFNDQPFTVYGFEEEDFERFINKNIEKLSEKHCKIFKMFVYDNYKHREIAKILNMNTNTVRVDYMKARKTIREIIKTELEKK
jgi:RNA polymerase sigma-70 factor (ECF subfamily)